MARHLDERDDRVWRWQFGALVTVAALFVIGVVYLVLHPHGAHGTPAAAAPAATVTTTGPGPAALACRQLAHATTVMSDRLDAAFAEHAKAHADFMAGRIKMGDEHHPAPGTVRWVWRVTLAERKDISPRYRELAAAWRQQCGKGS